MSTTQTSYAQVMKAKSEGKTPKIMKKLMFEIPREDTADPDQAAV